MPRRDEHGFHAGAGSEHGAHSFIFIHQCGAVALTLAGFPVFSHETALGHADGGDIGRDPHVAGETETPRMGQTLPITDEQIRFLLQLVQGFQEYRTFPE